MSANVLCPPPARRPRIAPFGSLARAPHAVALAPAQTIMEAVESFVQEKDLNKRGTKKENVACGFGNLAWGNGSTQGNVARCSKGKDGTVRVMSEMGLNEVKGLLEAALKKHGASYADKKKFAFNAADVNGPARCRLAFNAATIKLRELIKDKNPSFELSPQPAVLKARGAPWEVDDGVAGGKSQVTDEEMVRSHPVTASNA